MPHRLKAGNRHALACTGVPALWAVLLLNLNAYRFIEFLFHLAGDRNESSEKLKIQGEEYLQVAFDFLAGHKHRIGIVFFGARVIDQ